MLARLALLGSAAALPSAEPPAAAAAATSTIAATVAPGPSSTVSLMTADKLGDFADEGWEGYACSFLDWATCVNSTAPQSCDNTSGQMHPSCRKCTAKRAAEYFLDHVAAF